MYPHERSLVARLKNQPFVLLGINSDDDLSKLQPRLVKENITWPSFVNGSTDGPISRLYGVTAWPTIYVLDPKGIIRYKNVRGEAMDKAVDELLEEFQKDRGDTKADKAAGQSKSKSKTKTKSNGKKDADTDAASDKPASDKGT